MDLSDVNLRRLLDANADGREIALALRQIADVGCAQIVHLLADYFDPNGSTQYKITLKKRRRGRPVKHNNNYEIGKRVHELIMDGEYYDAAIALIADERHVNQSSVKRYYATYLQALKASQCE